MTVRLISIFYVSGIHVVHLITDCAATPDCCRQLLSDMEINPGVFIPLLRATASDCHDLASILQEPPELILQQPSEPEASYSCFGFNQ